MKWFLLKEDREEFAVQATDLAKAEEYAQMWNAVVIRECTPEEIKQLEDKNV